MESFTPTDAITLRSNLFSSSKFERTSGIKTKRKKKKKKKKSGISVDNCHPFPFGCLTVSNNNTWILL